MTVTYDDVAATLRPEVREAIELSMPCTNRFGHTWSWDSEWVRDGAGNLVRIDHWWQCAHCPHRTLLDPRSVELQRMARRPW